MPRIPRAPRDNTRGQLAAAIEAAEPFIRKSEQERIREALLSPTAVFPAAATITGPSKPKAPAVLGIARDALEAAWKCAVASLDSEQVEGEAGKGGEAR